MRVLGLDVGDRRIGVAVSDELLLTAQGVAVIQRQGLDSDLRQVETIIERHGVAGLVVGLPRNMDGSLGPQAEKVRRFADQLERRTGLPVQFWDERLTTVAAERVLLEGDVRRARRKQVIDRQAAILILQGYLDRRRTSGVSAGGLREE
ncbi:MAG: Holliday junction resolvase RuvX [Chloroflexi bacterium]|nr:Holliday junction resolvase RuvX [Chloroflexota bacterium]